MAGLSPAPGVRLDRLSKADVAAAAALSASIGWNQDEADWRRLVDLHPEGAVAARRQGELVGTATLVSYEGVAPVATAGALAWLGMVIVSPDARGQGIGSAVMDAALASWSAPQGGVVGLDATEFGAPLYERRGFQTVATIDRWAGRLAVRPAGAVRVRLAGPADLASLTALDRAETGFDRASLLEHLAAEESATLVVAERAGEPIGYAAIRSGRSHRHVGPLVTRDLAAVEPLLYQIAEYADGLPVFLDSVRGALLATRFEAFGLSVVRTLQRMTKVAQATDPTRPATPVMAATSVVAATGFEWG
ncbi:MAG TPA: GNAT family N-acetyltransferase [Trueperaceae bacterium]|nr:GNAT family N-acetyltransferase [Trueperaceae bacterium]